MHEEDQQKAAASHLLVKFAPFRSRLTGFETGQFVHAIGHNNYNYTYRKSIILDREESPIDYQRIMIVLANNHGGWVIHFWIIDHNRDYERNIFFCLEAASLPVILSRSAKRTLYTFSQ